MKSRSLAGVLALVLVFGLLVTAVPATAQTLQAFNIERSIALNAISTQIPPNIPANVLAALAGGALEIREALVYNQPANTLTSTVFLVPTGSPLPTPSLVLALQTGFVATTTMSIDRIYVTSTPYPSLLFVGSLVQSTTTPFGNYQGAVETVSVGYTNDTPPKLNTVMETVAGAVSLYSPSAVANAFTVKGTSSGGGGGGGGTGAPTVVINPASQTSIGREVVLDASGSTDPNGLSLTYSWTYVGSPIPTLLHSNSAQVTVQLTNGPGVYTIQVTVTNSAGKSSTGTATINYVGH